MGIPWPQRKEIREVLESGMFEGVPFEILEREIEPGDHYLAQRNVGVKLLTCKENNKERFWIVPMENAYPYDTHECVPIMFVID